MSNTPEEMVLVPPDAFGLRAMSNKLGEIKSGLSNVTDPNAMGSKLDETVSGPPHPTFPTV